MAKKKTTKRILKKKPRRIQRKKLKFGIRRIKNDEYVVFRNSKGYRKPKKGKKYVAEVRSRKTKKIVGYLNKREGKSNKPSFRQFGSVEKSIKTTRRIRRHTLVAKTSWSFWANSRFPMVEQVTKKAGAAIDAVIAEIKREKVANVYVDLESEEYGQFRSQAFSFTRGYSRERIIQIIAIELIINELVRENQFRMSPKKYARSENDKTKRTIEKALFTITLATF